MASKTISLRASTVLVRPGCRQAPWLSLAVVRWALFGMLAWLLAASRPAGAAAPPEGPLAGEELLVPGWAGTKEEPVLAYDSDAGQYLLAWRFAGTGLPAIQAIRLLGTGQPLDALPTPLSDPRPGEKGWPALAYGGSSQGYLICWHYDSSGTGANWDIYCRFFHPGGQWSLGPELALADTRANEWRPALARGGGSGAFLLAWNSSPPGAVEGIAGALVRHGQPPELSRFSVPECGLAQRHPALAYGAREGKFLLAWQRAQPGGQEGSYDVYAALFDEAQAQIAEGPLALAAGPKDEARPVAGHFAGAGPYILTWQAQYAGDDYDILAQLIGPNFVPLGAPLRIAFTIRPELAAAVACNATLPQCLVAWQEEEERGRGVIRARHVYADGSLGPAFAIADSAQRSATMPAVAAGEGEYLVAWAAARPDEEPSEIRTRPVHATYTFRGAAYHGQPGKPEVPLAGVQLQLLGDLDADPFGQGKATVLAASTTAEDGTFSLSWEPDSQYPYYHVLRLEGPGEACTGMSLKSAFGAASGPCTVTYANLPPGLYAGIESYALVAALLPHKVYLPLALAGS